MVRQTKQKRITPVHELIVVFGILLFVWAVGALFYHLVEKIAFVDAIYFTAITLTTVGYGDFTPQTTAGKLFTAIYSFTGIGLFFGFAAALFQEVVEKLRSRK